MRSDRRGNMPFAVIAVTILLMSVCATAAMAAHDRASDGAEGLEEDARAVDVSMAGMTAHVNRGLGNIIMAVSAGDGMGGKTLEERSEVFMERAGSWFDRNFPLVDNGSRATLVSHDIDLIAEPVGFLSEDEEAGGYIPAYLRGVGTVRVDLETQTGRSTVDLDVSSDGSYALPLAAGQASIFESMAGGGGISLSQMMSHQLTSLAQHRVMNGYGSVSEYGSEGTMSIVTAEDVEEAYRNALEAIGMICFRSTDGDLAGRDAVDLADVLVSEDGVVTVDLAALYSQSMVAALDEMATGWFDYFCGEMVLSGLDERMKRYGPITMAIEAFIDGREPFSAEPYIREVMEINGIPEQSYRYPGSGETVVDIGGHVLTVENPTVDLFGMTWVDRFELGYHQDTNYVREHIRDVLNSAAKRISSADLGTVEIAIDPYDETRFLESVSEAVREATEGSMRAIQTHVSWSLENGTFNDPFYGAICSEINSRGDDMVLSSEFMESVRSGLRSLGLEYEAIDALMSSDDASYALERYRHAVISDLAVFDALREVPGGQPGAVKEILSTICAYGLEATGIARAVPEAAGILCDEMLALDGMNPRAGITELPGSGSFELDYGDGNIAIESLDLSTVPDPAVLQPTLVEGKCVHTVGFGEDVCAAYSTVFRVSLIDPLAYTVVGKGAVAEAIGTASSVVEGTADVSVSMEITVVSGWGLAGVDYSASTTVVEDLWAIALDALEPIIEPLRKIMEVFRTAFTFLGEAVVEVARYVAAVIADLFEDIIEPLEEIAEWIETSADRVFSQAMLDILFDIGLDDQSVTFEFFGYTLEIETNAMSWVESTKTLFTATLSGPVADVDVSAGITVKARGGLASENLIVTGHGSVDGNGWGLKGKVDPLMKGNRYLMTLDGDVGDTDISLILPELVEYHELGIGLRDVPGVGSMLECIPLPMLGVNIGLDAGFDLKYSAPMQRGLIVNEFESNPSGDDHGNEWVELLNNSTHTIDLEGYTLTASSDWRSKVMTLSGSISPGEFLVLEPDFTLVNDSGKYTRNGEALTLKDPDGVVVDKTPTMKDTGNDGDTVQREFDGCTEWILGAGSMGSSNSRSSWESVVSAEDMRGVVWRAVNRAFGDVGSITDTASLQAFLESLVHNTLEGTVEHITGQIVEASVYVSVDVLDATSSMATGVRVALRADSELAEDVLKYLVGQVESLVLGMDNPYRIDPTEMFTENIDLEVTFHTGIGAPRILGETDLPELDVGVTFRTNLAAITSVLGEDTGRPEVVCGVRILDCPVALIPPRMNPDEDMEHDLWLLRLSVRFA